MEGSTARFGSRVSGVFYVLCPLAGAITGTALEEYLLGPGAVTLGLLGGAVVGLLVAAVLAWLLQEKD
jgi:hypothetical protein